MKAPDDSALSTRMLSWRFYARAVWLVPATILGPLAVVVGLVGDEAVLTRGIVALLAVVSGWDLFHVVTEVMRWRRDGDHYFIPTRRSPGRVFVAGRDGSVTFRPALALVGSIHFGDPTASDSFRFGPNIYVGKTDARRWVANEGWT